MKAGPFPPFRVVETVAATIKHLVARITSHVEGCVYLRKQLVYKNIYRYKLIERSETRHVPSILIVNKVEDIQEDAS